MKAYRERRTAERYALAVDLLGGVCAKCGVIDKFDFDHIDPASKSYVISTHLWDYSWKRLLLELAKCQLLCRKCHNHKTHGKPMGHGGGMSGIRGCKCEPCKIKKREYMRNYIRIRK